MTKKLTIWQWVWIVLSCMLVSLVAMPVMGAEKATLKADPSFMILVEYKSALGIDIPEMYLRFMQGAVTMHVERSLDKYNVKDVFGNASEGFLHFICLDMGPSVDRVAISLAWRIGDYAGHTVDSTCRALIPITIDSMLLEIKDR